MTAWAGYQRALAFAPPSTAATIVDFDVFHLVGRLVLEGRLPEAYRSATLNALESRLSLDIARSIPFAYPPPFALAMAGLARLPVPIAYALFESVGFTLLACALRQASPLRFWPVMLAMIPAIFVNVIAGQNGMLTAGLAGLATLLSLEGQGLAAGALGGSLAALKPQSCMALPLLFIGRRDWRPLVAMGASASALLVMSAMVLGPEILPAFLHALSETSAFLAQGRFPLHRMVSVYAFLRSLGVSAGVAMVLQLTTALAVLCAVALTARRIGDARAGSGLMLIGACFVSPYLYDYDLPIAGLGLAMALPGTISRWWPALALCCLMLAESSGLVETFALPIRVSLGGPLLLACLAWVLLAWRRHAGRSPAGAAVSVPA